MQTINNIQELRAQITSWRQQGLKIAFVPTMGNLHDGHISLVDEAHKHADKVVASIFVNPMQFGANEDIDKYPRTLENDKLRLSQANTDLLFTPTPEIIYPKGLNKQTFVEVPDVSDGYCGESRPGHFRGVSTIVCKLFNLVQPDVACFGLKDYQQVQVIKLMVEDLSMPIEIIPVETKREASGLAMSSRNTYLSADEKVMAAHLNKAMRWVAEQVQFNKDYNDISTTAYKMINAAGMKTDYLHICNSKTLNPATTADNQLVILAAAHCGKARLIDNILVDL